MTEVFAHRGSSGTHPENTMAAFIEAERVGADGLEFDIQMTRDSELVVIHDERVDRTTNGVGWVQSMTLKELKKLNAGSKKSRTEKIPTLKEVLGWAKGNHLRLNLELKTGLIEYPRLEEKVLDMIHHYGVSGRAILSSFNPSSVKKVHEIDSRIETAFLFMERLVEPWKYAKSIGASGLHCYWRRAASGIIENTKQAKLSIRPFTVNRKSHMQRFMKAGCTGIFTDWPEKALQVRNKLQRQE